MFHNERVIAVETFYSYTPVIPFLKDLFDLDVENSVYKVAFSVRVLVKWAISKQAAEANEAGHNINRV